MKNKVKKFACAMLVGVMTMSSTVSTFAITPPIKINVPKIPNIKVPPIKLPPSAFK